MSSWHHIGRKSFESNILPLSDCSPWINSQNPANVMIAHGRQGGGYTTKMRCQPKSQLNRACPRYADKIISRKKSTASGEEILNRQSTISPPGTLFRIKRRIEVDL